MSNNINPPQGIYVRRYTVPDPGDPFCSYIKRVTYNRGMCNHEDVQKLENLACEMLEIIESLEHCSDYWSEYYVPIGIVERMKNVIAQAKGNKHE